MNKLILSLALLLVSLTTWAQQFDTYFYNKTLRYDYYHAGDSQKEYFFFDKLIEEPYWAGSKTHLIDELEYGNHIFRLFDVESGKEIYSRGFCTLFNEWQHTPEAQTTQIAHPEGLVMPYPKRMARIEIETRNERNEFVKIYEHTFDPTSYLVEKPNYSEDVFEVHYSGKPEQKVDIVLLAEGYAASDRAKFEEDCRIFKESMFKFSPYKENADKFNIRAVWTPSAEQGVTIPGEGIWKNSRMGAKFYTFGSERYQMSDDLQKVRDVAANAPYDLIYILTNTQKYGGGGVYNYYGISAAHNTQSTDKIYIHEFGHLFLGLGDEYDYGGEDMPLYGKSVEPWEANVTTLADFEKKYHWKPFLEEGLQIPTPKIASNNDKLGVYEGAGYYTKGMYRPAITCLMRDFTGDEFCPVCTRAIIEMIEIYTKK